MLAQLLVAVVIATSLVGGCTQTSVTPTSTPAPAPSGASYPWHSGIIATTFWVGEVFDPHAPDGSQVVSTYDSQWLAHYGGCDGVTVNRACQTEPRAAANGFFPQHMTPRQNPFYLDLPFDDINNANAHATRGSVVPWASAPSYAAHASDPNVSFMKNRWVTLRRGSRICFGQIEDAGPGDYDDAAYVFGANDARPANTKFNGAGADVSPALNGCLRFAALNGDNDRIDWQFVDDAAVPPGPWKTIVTTQGVTP